MVDREENTDAVVSISDLRFGWGRDGPTIIDIARFDVAPGEKVFVRGPSGSGKTSLLNLIGGVARPRSGTVRILGADIAVMPSAGRDRFRADHIGFIFQQFNLIPYLGLIDNVALPCRFSRRRGRNATARSGSPEAEARRLLERMRIDASTISSNAVAELSVGQQQRVAAARSLIGTPELIIADEPTSAIDDDARQAFLDLLFEEAEIGGNAILFVSHDGSLARFFDRDVALSALNRGGASS